MFGVERKNRRQGYLGKGGIEGPLEVLRKKSLGVFERERAEVGCLVEMKASALAKKSRFDLCDPRIEDEQATRLKHRTKVEGKAASCVCTFEIAR